MSKEGYVEVKGFAENGVLLMPEGIDIRPSNSATVGPAPKPYLDKVVIDGEEEDIPKSKEETLKELGGVLLEQDKSSEYLNGIQRAIDIIK